MKRKPIRSPLISFEDIFLTLLLILFSYLIFVNGMQYQRRRSTADAIMMQRLINDCAKRLDEK